LQLVRHPVDQCSTLTSCDDCAGSIDPICGWCGLQAECAQLADCPEVNDNDGVPQRVFVQEDYLCPRIERTDPRVIHLQQLEVSTGRTLDPCVRPLGILVGGGGDCKNFLQLFLLIDLLGTGMITH